VKTDRHQETSMQRTFLTAAGAALLLLAGCAGLQPARPLACDDGLKAAFHPDELTRVVAVRAVRAGEQLVAVDSPQPITAARDMCLVKLLVGPGVKQEKDASARSYSEGIGMEIWLPSGWNQRIRNYGGGGWVGGGHRFAGQIGSKVPAIVNANMGYASGTHDGGQPHYQDPSFLFLSDGRVNGEAMRDMSSRAIHEQAVKTEALVRLFYGQAPRFRYYDGHSQGGRQGMKAAQQWPELYDGFLIGQPAINVPKFSLTSLWPQIVMKSELGIDASNKEAAAAFAKKMEAATVGAVKACDREGLGFLLDPMSCSWDPAQDPSLSAREAQAIRRIWQGPVRGGQRVWAPLTKGSSFAGQITSASTDMVALAMKDVSYSASPAAASGIPLANGSTARRDRWRELDEAAYLQLFDKAQADPMLADYATDQADLRKLRDLGRKVVMWNGLAEDVIPPGGAIDYWQRVGAAMGGEAEVRKFLRMYMMPGMAHSSQGRAWTVDNTNNAVPMPKLPGNTNQNPTREQDTLFSALVDWVERGVAPEDIVLTSRDGAVSYPVCVFPRMITWDGRGSPRQAASYSCR
jgi:feruloyl esterase